MTRHTASTLLTLGALSTGLTTLWSGCDLTDAVGPYVAPFAAEVVFISIPTDSLQEFGITMEPVVLCTVALGQVKDADTSTTGTETSIDESAPFSGEGVAGATITLVDPEGKSFVLNDEANVPGLYFADNTANPEMKYVEGSNYEVKIDFNGESYWSRFQASPAISLTNPSEMGQYQAPNTTLTATWDPVSDNAVVAVFDSAGNELYNNLPQDLNTLYTFLTAEPVSSWEIPASAFPRENELYGVAVAGLERASATEANFSANLNYIISNTVTGVAVVTGVTSYVIPTDIPTTP